MAKREVRETPRTGYCFRCDDVQPFAKVTERRTRNLHRVLQGFCARCGSVMMRFAEDGDEIGPHHTVKVGRRVKEQLRITSIVTKRSQRAILEDILDKFLYPYAKAQLLNQVESGEVTLTEASSLESQMSEANPSDLKAHSTRVETHRDEAQRREDDLPRRLLNLLSRIRGEGQEENKLRRFDGDD